MRRFAWIWTYVLLVALCSCTARQKIPSYRYKITVIVDTPQGVRVGTAVREVSAQERLNFSSAWTTIFENVDGEAVAVDLPDGKTLFGLLTGNSVDSRADQIALTLLHPDPKAQYPQLAAALAHGSYRGEVSPVDYPTFVTFANNAQASTVRRVDPDHLAADFGPSVHLRSVLVSTTNEPVTRALESRLPWLKSMEGEVFTDERIAAAGLNLDEFITK